MYGKADGFDVMIYAEDSGTPTLLTIHTAARNPSGAILDSNEAKEFAGGAELVKSLEEDGNHIVVHLWNEFKLNKLTEKLPGALRQTLSFLRSRGFVPCCSICGKETEVSGILAGGDHYHLCLDCEGTMRGNMTAMIQQKGKKRENIVGGIVGAFLGSLLGVLCIVLLSQLGYVAAISGAVMAVGVLKGYELLGGKLTKKGVVIGVVIMLLMTWLGDRLSWAILLYRAGGGAEVGYNLFDCYRLVPYAVKSEIIDPGSYGRDIAMIYAFLLLGAIPTIRSRVKDDQEEAQMRRLGSVSNSLEGMKS
ncbi:MAG: hypothetical protein NC432_03655 [Roseburia sp.]|nr:hypothetical protein [Roseburia sp.]MCM1098439.1 hypothetical protein [Ruminococcus flavefaciens]